MLSGLGKLVTVRADADPDAARAALEALALIPGRLDLAGAAREVVIARRVSDVLPNHPKDAGVWQAQSRRLVIGTHTRGGVPYAPAAIERIAVHEGMHAVDKRAVWPPEYLSTSRTFHRLLQEALVAAQAAGVPVHPHYRSGVYRDQEAFAELAACWLTGKPLSLSGSLSGTALPVAVVHKLDGYFSRVLGSEGRSHDSAGPAERVPRRH